MKNHFEVLGIKESFKIDLKELEQKYFALQRQFHPDKFAGKGDSEKALATKQSSQVNEAYDMLKEPLLRASYLLKIKGIIDPKADQGMLMQMMELRENFEEADEKEAAKIIGNIIDEREKAFGYFADKFEKGDIEGASAIFVRLKYLDKFLGDVK